MSRPEEGPSAAALATWAALVLVDGWTQWRTDPDGSEPEPGDVAGRRLSSELDGFETGVHRMLVDGVAAGLATDPTEQRMHEMAIVAQAADLVPRVHRMHQRLLSMWPAVPLPQVEQARLLEADLRRLVAEADIASWPSLVRRAQTWSAALPRP